MSKDALSGLEMGYSSYKYFPNELHPAVIALGTRSYVRESQYSCRNELEYILVRSGSGSCVVNSESFPVSRGNAAVFLSFDFYKFVPNDGETLVVDYFRISVGTYLFMLASPYNAKVDADVSRHRFHTPKFESPALEDVERLLDEMLALKNCNVPYDDAMMVYTLMEYIAKFDRLARQFHEKRRECGSEH